MARRNGLVFVIILVIFAFTLWTIIPINGERFGRQGMRLGLDLVGGVHLVYQGQFSANATASEKSTAMDRVRLTIEKRIDAFGVTEPVIQKLGEDRILIQLPGFTDIEAAKKQVEQTGFLEFREVEKNATGGLVYLKDYLIGTVTDFFNKTEKATRIFVNEAGEGKEYGKLVASLSMTESGLKFTDSNGNPVDNATLQQYGNNASWIPARGTDGTPLTGGLLSDAQPNLGGNLGTEPQVDIKWNAVGTVIFDQIAARLYDPTDQSLSHALGIFLDSNLISAPRVRAQAFHGSGVISGGFKNLDDAANLADLLKSGALPVQLIKPPLFQEKVSATLGAEFIDKSWKAGLVAILLVMLFMIAYYRLPGLMASLALIFYATLTLAICKLWPITLSLGGIGGIIVSMGIAVDANVLIFERMKEEFRAGRTLGAAIEAGFHRAWSAIWDSNVTTFIACIILFWLGSSAMHNAAVTGFAITLFIGAVVSMFTAVTVTRTLLRMLTGSSLAKKSWLFLASFGNQKQEKMLDIIGKRFWFFLISGVFILIAVVSLATFGLKPSIEFSSGSLLTVRLDTAVDYTEFQQAVADLGYPDAIVQKVGDTDYLIRTGELSEDAKAQLEAGLTSRFGTLSEAQFSSVSPMVAQETARNALIAVIIAMVGMLLYVTWAFRKMPNPFRWGTCFTIALFHDILVTVGLFSLFGRIFGWEMNLMFITGILGIVGVSLDNTIVVFDRMRENQRLGVSADFEVVVNRSQIETLSRSLNTSFTILITLLTLLLFIGGTIQNFVIVLIIGLIAGTFDSVFVAPGLLVVWDKHEWGRFIGRKPAPAAPAKAR